MYGSIKLNISSYRVFVIILSSRTKNTHVMAEENYH